MGTKTVEFHDEEGEVICDLCNCDGDATEEVDGVEIPLYMGGGLVGSYALCPNCMKKIDRTDRPEDITDFDPTKSFAENVRAYRLQTYGTEDLVITVTSWDGKND